MKKWILGLVLASLAAFAWALPSVQDVEAEVRQGRYAEAETMMREVVAARQSSAKAHYIYAEILAKNGKLPLAAEEAQKARLLDPDIKFTDPAKFSAFEAALLQAQRPSAARNSQDVGRPPAAAPAPAPRPAESSGLPSWIWLAGLAVIGFMLWRGFTRNRAAAAAAAAPGVGVAAPGAAFGAGVPGQVGAQGAPFGAGAPGVAQQRSGMLGTGLAAAGGVAAGMLASEMLRRHQSPESDLARDESAQPGSFDSPGAGNALEDRPIDFGSGGDWDAGGGDGGGGDGGSWD